MLALLKKAVAVYKQEGIGELGKRTVHHIKYMLYRAGGARFKLRPGNVEVRMLVPTYSHYQSIDYVYRTERAVLDLLLSELRPGDVFWDVGANLGIYTCLIAASCNHVRVFAFEPNPTVIWELKENVSLNNLQNVTVSPLALLDTDGEVPFDPVWQDKPSPHGKVLTAQEPAGKVKVRCARGESLVWHGDMPQPQVVKIDVEGAECSVVRGMAGLLDHVRMMIVEAHPAKGAEAGELEAILAGAEFKLEGFGQRDLNFWLKAIR